MREDVSARGCGGDTRTTHTQPPTHTHTHTHTHARTHTDTPTFTASRSASCQPHTHNLPPLFPDAHHQSHTYHSQPLLPLPHTGARAHTHTHTHTHTHKHTCTHHLAPTQPQLRTYLSEGIRNISFGPCVQHAKTILVPTCMPLTHGLCALTPSCRTTRRHSTWQPKTSPRRLPQSWTVW